MTAAALIDPEIGSLFTLDEFEDMVRNGSLIDYDGMGNWATATHVIGDDWIYPSTFKRGQKPPLATHIIWYNR